MTVACIGGGPSLTQDDVDRLRGRCFVIAINDAYRLAPWADILYAADYQWWEWHNGVPCFDGRRYTITSSQNVYWPGVKVLRNLGPDGFGVDGLCGRNSGHQAVNLAANLGATRIILLGYDMGVDRGRSHWFGEHPVASPNHYETFISAFETLKQPLHDRGIAVFNCSRKTRLTTFQLASLDDALKVAA